MPEKECVGPVLPASGNMGTWVGSKGQWIYSPFKDTTESEYMILVKLPSITIFFRVSKKHTWYGWKLDTSHNKFMTYYRFSRQYFYMDMV